MMIHNYPKEIGELVSKDGFSHKNDVDRLFVLGSKIREFVNASHNIADIVMM